MHVEYESDEQLWNTEYDPETYHRPPVVLVADNSNQKLDIV